MPAFRQVWGRLPSDDNHGTPSLFASGELRAVPQRITRQTPRGGYLPPQGRRGDWETKRSPQLERRQTRSACRENSEAPGQGWKLASGCRFFFFFIFFFFLVFFFVVFFFFSCFSAAARLKSIGPSSLAGSGPTTQRPVNQFMFMRRTVFVLLFFESEKGCDHQLRPSQATRGKRLGSVIGSYGDSVPKMSPISRPASMRDWW